MPNLRIKNMKAHSADRLHIEAGPENRKAGHMDQDEKRAWHRKTKTTMHGLYYHLNRGRYSIKEASAFPNKKRYFILIVTSSKVYFAWTPPVT